MEYEQRKALVGQQENRANQYTKVEVDHNDPPPQSTAQKIAKEYNVSEPTIKRDAQFAKGLDVIAEVSPEIKEEVLQSQSDLTKKQVSDFAEIEKEKQAAIERAEKGSKTQNYSLSFLGLL